MTAAEPIPSEPSAASPRARLSAWLERPVAIAPLVFFRLLFGSFVVFKGLDFAFSSEFETYFVYPRVRFQYWGWGWVPELSGGIARGALLLLALGGAGVLLGLFYRASALLVALLWTWLLFSDALLYQNHFYLLMLLAWILVFVPAGRALSLDARRGRVAESTDAPAWSLWILRFQLGVVYVYGGIAKLNADWLAGEPMRTWLADPLRTARFPELVACHFGDERLVLFMAWSGMLLDLLIVPALLWRATRYAALAGISAFHVANHFLWEIDIFPWFMLLATLLFLPPRHFRRAFERLGAWRGDVTRHRAAPAPLAPALAALLAAHVAFQLLFPLRHFLYPGDSKWTEEGNRFAWHMKLRDKRTVMSPTFRVVEPDGLTHLLEAGRVAGRIVDLDDGSELARAFARFRFFHVCSKPRALQQLARVIQRDFAEAGRPGVAVYVENLLVSLNGRPPQPLVDPDTDLASLPLSLGPADWIVPLEGDAESTG